MNAKQETYAARIAKLLRKAESTTPEEAEALVAKAQELMTAYAVDEAMIANAHGESMPEEIVEETIEYTGIFQAALMQIGYNIVRSNNCRGLSQTFPAFKPSGRPKTSVLYVIGFKRDVDRVRMLDSSVQVQAASALNVWWKRQNKSWMSGMEKFKARREFLLGFASGLASRLEEARKQGEAEAIKNEADRMGGGFGSGVQAEAAQTVTLVLRTRKEQVNDWVDSKYGDTIRTTRRRYSSGGAGARSAGHAAGRSANTGTTGIGGAKGALGR